MKGIVRLTTGRLVAAVMFSLTLVCTAPPVHAAFHFVVIEELMSGYNGDPDVQYVELRMFNSGQTVVQNKKLTTFNGDGSSFTVFNIPSNVTNGAINARILFGTAEFALASGISPDFTIPSLISTPSGMVCFGNPTVANQGVPSQYVDCVAYGSYTGPTRAGSGTPTHRPPGDDLNTLGRINISGNNAADFSLLVPTPRNNADQDGDLGLGGPTTTTTSTTSTTTTSTTTTTTLVPLCGVAPEPTINCYLAEPNKSQVQYKDKDPGVASKKDKLKWKFAKPLDPLATADFKDPFGGAATYRVCVYDAGVKVSEMDMPPGGVCATKPCWKLLGTKGFKYKDKEASPTGINGALFKSGDAGKGQVQIKGKGSNLPMPLLPVVGPVVVQMLIDDGITIECFQNEFTAPFQKNDANQFKAKGP